jgi:hypothetical protein
MIYMAIKKEQTSEVVVELLELEQYLAQEKVHPGTVASFKSETLSKPEMLAPKTLQAWHDAFEEQRNRAYN